MGADVLAFVSPIDDVLSEQIREAVEFRKNAHSGRSTLAVLLETPGGFIESAERIANTFRAHYSKVEFIVPNYAFSAGTVLVMSGDAIHMDYYSVLGPIDPQVRRNGVLVPALGYLAEYKRLINKDKQGKLSSAELALLIEKVDLAQLHQFKQQRRLSVSLLKKWLVQYKFKDWKTTRDRNLTVDDKMREERAVQIADRLNQTKRWGSHGRGIPMAVLQAEGDDGLNLLIDDFGSNSAINEPIRSYYRLLMDYMQAVGNESVVHVLGKYTPLN